MKSLCIVPCWNEENRLSNLINQIKNFDQSKYLVDFLFINNGSSDNSLKILKNSKMKVKSYNKNKGIGFALIDGLKIGIKNNYDIIFCPWKYDQHPDHISTFNLLRKVLVKYPIESEIWLYEVWTPVAANKVIDISTTITHKLKAAKMYVSQNECIDYYQKFSALAKYRSIHIPPAEFAGAFLCGDRKFILSL